MNIREFLENPVGKGDASIPNKSLIIGALDMKYDKLTDGSKGKQKAIKMNIFRNPSSDTYYFWLVIPTETERDNTYDVVYKFLDKEKMHRKDLSINKYDIQIFSNTPSFAYTYSYVYNKEGLLIKELADKLGRRFLTDSPDVRNKNENIMYDKYIYFGARYILDSKKMNRVVLETIAKPYDEKYLHSHIRSLEKIMDDYRKAENKLKKKKTKQSNPEKVNKSTSKTSGVHYKTPVKQNKGISKTTKVKPKVNKTKSTINKS